MKAVVAAFVLMSAPVVAQTLSLPPHFPTVKTITLFDNVTKRPLGTITLSDRRIYFRTPEGKHYATVAFNNDGTRTAYDPSGNVIDPSTLPGYDDKQ